MRKTILLLSTGLIGSFAAFGTGCSSGSGSPTPATVQQVAPSSYAPDASSVPTAGTGTENPALVPAASELNTASQLAQPGGASVQAATADLPGAPGSSSSNPPSNASSLPAATLASLSSVPANGTASGSSGTASGTTGGGSGTSTDSTSTPPAGLSGGAAGAAGGATTPSLLMADVPGSAYGGGAGGSGAGAKQAAFGSLFGASRDTGIAGRAPASLDFSGFSGAQHAIVPTSGSIDPEDYFTRLDATDNLFKVVERVYQHTAMNWATASARNTLRNANALGTLRTTQGTRQPASR